MVTQEARRNSVAIDRHLITLEQDQFLTGMVFYGNLLQHVAETLQEAASGKLVAKGYDHPNGVRTYAITDPERALVIELPEMYGYFGFDTRLARDLGEQFSVKHDRATRTLVVSLLQDK